MRPLTRYTRGVGLIEAVVVISIMSTAFAAILGASVFFLRGGFMASDRTQAMYLLEEGVEAVRFMRDNGYTANISPLIGAGTRYMYPSTTGWSASTTNTALLGEFTRTVVLEQVYRRTADSDIVASTSADIKAVDPHTARLTVTVSWSGDSMEAVTYVADIYEN